MNDMSVLIVAGGTGGHISPGIALYEEFRENGMRPLFLTGKRDERFSSLREVAPDDMKLYRAPSFSKNPAKIFVFPSLFTGAVLVARTIIRRNGVRAVIGMGGYVSAPALVAAKLLKTPLFLCEQNSVPGKVTKFFEKHAHRIYGTFKTATEYLNCIDKYIHAGNPIRKKLLVDTHKDNARKAFHLGHVKK